MSVGCIVQAQDDEPVHAAAIGAVAAPDDPLARDLADTTLNEVVLRDNEPVVLLRDDADGDGATATTPPHGDVARLGLGEVYNEDEEAWEREMNEELAQYGLALGDENKQLAAYWLEEL